MAKNILQNLSEGKNGVQSRKLTINLPESTFRELQELSARSQRSMTEIVRAGFGLAKIAFDEQSRQNKLSVTNSEGKTIKDIVIP